MQKVYIGLGSNLGDGMNTLQRAWGRIGQHDRVELEKLSSPYRSQPVGMESENWFTNAVGCFTTSLTPEETLQFMLEVEAEFGRERVDLPGYQDRTLDLDILQIDDTVVNESFLILPHPEMVKRLFVLQPLAEIAADLVHPVTGLNSKEMCTQLEKRLAVVADSSQELSKQSWPDSGK